MFVCCECCVLSVRGLCNELITCPNESYRLWCVVVCDLETSRMRRPWPAFGRRATRKKGTISLMYSGQGMKIATQAEVKVKWSYATISLYIYMPCVEKNFT
jgi:hypothetical protein